jgi:hypothetical protein
MHRPTIADLIKQEAPILCLNKTFSLSFEADRPELHAAAAKEAARAALFIYLATGSPAGICYLQEGDEVTVVVTAILTPQYQRVIEKRFPEGMYSAQKVTDGPELDNEEGVLA